QTNHDIHSPVLVMGKSCPKAITPVIELLSPRPDRFICRKISVGLSSQSHGSRSGLSCPLLNTSNASRLRSNTSTNRNHTPSARPAAVDVSLALLLRK